MYKKRWSLRCFFYWLFITGKIHAMQISLFRWFCFLFFWILASLNPVSVFSGYSVEIFLSQKQKLDVSAVWFLCYSPVFSRNCELGKNHAPVWARLIKGRWRMTISTYTKQLPLNSDWIMINQMDGINSPPFAKPGHMWAWWGGWGGGGGLGEVFKPVMVLQFKDDMKQRKLRTFWFIYLTLLKWISIDIVNFNNSGFQTPVSRFCVLGFPLTESDYSFRWELFVLWEITQFENQMTSHVIFSRVFEDVGRGFLSYSTLRS